jgi:CDP-diacylglycerol--serine O-phosphatidyltransferase
VELDSLCDVVSFGIAPSIMLYLMFFHQWLNWGLLLASLPSLAGVLRLARFNVQLSGLEDKAYFRGMPIPAGAFTIVSYLMFTHRLEFIPTDWLPILITSVTIITSLAMVSTIKYDNVPRPTAASFKQRPVFFLVFLAGLVISLVTGGKAIFPVMMLYMVGGAIRHVVNAFRARGEEEEDDTLEEPDPDPFSL